MKKKIIILLTSIAMLLFVLCITYEADAGTSAFNLTTQSKSIAGGKSIALKINGVKSKKVKWKSSKPSVATVSKTGIVTGIKKGRATITGKYRGIKFTVKITVTSNPETDSDKSKTDEAGLYLGTVKNIDFYYIKRTKNTIYIKAVNNNNINLKVKFDYFNIDSETIDGYESDVVAANDFRVIKFSVDGVVPEPQTKISTYVEIWKEDYSDFGKGSLSATIK